jgi:hypothetical protein
VWAARPLDKKLQKNFKKNLHITETRFIFAVQKTYTAESAPFSCHAAYNAR